MRVAVAREVITAVFNVEWCKDKPARSMGLNLTLHHVPKTLVFLLVGAGSTHLYLPHVVGLQAVITVLQCHLIWVLDVPPINFTIHVVLLLRRLHIRHLADMFSEVLSLTHLAFYLLPALSLDLNPIFLRHYWLVSIVYSFVRISNNRPFTLY